MIAEADSPVVDDMSEEDILKSWARDKPLLPESGAKDLEDESRSENPPGHLVEEEEEDAEESAEEEEEDDAEEESGEEEEEEDSEALPEETEGELDEWAADLEPEVQAKIRAKNAAFRQRIDKLKTQRDGAREEREAAAAERELIREKANAMLRKPVPLARNEAEPLSHVTSQEELAAEITEAENAVQWAIDNADGVDMQDAKGQPISYTAQQVARIKARAETVLARHVPRREKYLAEHAAHSAEARKAFPRIYMDGTPEKQYALSIMNAVPEIARLANYEIILGELARGHVVALDEKQGVSWVKVKPRGDAPGKTKAPAAKVQEKEKPKPKAAPAPLAGGTRPAALAPGQKPDPGARLAQSLKEGKDSDTLERDVMRSLEARFGRSA